MQLTNTGNSNGTKMALGTIGVYRGKNKETDQPEFDNLPFVAYGAVSEYIKQDTKMMLSGKINGSLSIKWTVFMKLVAF